MVTWQLILTLIVSGGIFYMCRRTVLSMAELARATKDDPSDDIEDTKIKLQLSLFSCLGMLTLFPVAVLSGLLFILSLLALIYS